jgi:hypothetical protein
VCSSPWLIAAYHGLHRLRVPRHPPHAFARLTTNASSRARAIYDVMKLVQRLALDSFPTITTNEQLSNSDLTLAWATPNALQAQSLQSQH